MFASIDTEWYSDALNAGIHNDCARWQIGQGKGTAHDKGAIVIEMRWLIGRLL